MCVIYYTTLLKNKVVGSTNKQKIESLAIYKDKVFSCDISEFKGTLLSSEWYGRYKSTVPKQINFKRGLKW